MGLPPKEHEPRHHEEAPCFHVGYVPCVNNLLREQGCGLCRRMQNIQGSGCWKLTCKAVLKSVWLL